MTNGYAPSKRRKIASVDPRQNTPPARNSIRMQTRLPAQTSERSVAKLNV